MVGPDAMIGLSAAGLGAICLTSAVGLSAWRGWLDLKRVEISRKGPPTPIKGSGDVAELKARLKKLEAIASGVEL